MVTTRWQHGAVALYVACFTIGGVNHAIDFAQRGWRPYRWAPLPYEIFWSALIVLDFATVALLLAGYRRTGLLLALAIMLSDVTMNASAVFGPGFAAFSSGLVLQSLFLGFVLGSFAPLWPAAPPIN